MKFPVCLRISIFSATRSIRSESGVYRVRLEWKAAGAQ